MFQETRWPFSRLMPSPCSFTSPAILLHNLHQIPCRGVVLGLPASCNQRKQVKDPRGFWQNENGGAAHSRGWWLFRHRSPWFLSVCCLPAVKASLSPSPSLMGSSGFEEVMIHAFNWCVFYRAEIHVSLLARWWQLTDMAVSCWQPVRWNVPVLGGLSV